MELLFFFSCFSFLLLSANATACWTLICCQNRGISQGNSPLLSLWRHCAVAHTTLLYIVFYIDLIPVAFIPFIRLWFIYWSFFRFQSLNFLPEKDSWITNASLVIQENVDLTTASIQVQTALTIVITPIIKSALNFYQFGGDDFEEAFGTPIDPAEKAFWSFVEMHVRTWRSTWKLEAGSHSARPSLSLSLFFILIIFRQALAVACFHRFLHIFFRFDNPFA